MFTNFLYPWARNEFLKGGISWTADTFGVMFLNAGVGTNTIYSGSGVTGYAAEPNAYTGNWAGWSITYLSQVPFGHRTFNATNPISQFGGTAVTHLLTTSNTDGNGVADASDITFYAVPSAGQAVSAFLIYRRPTAAMTSFASTTDQDANSRLIAYFGSAVGMPVTPNGGDITIQWDNTATTKVFRL